MSPSKPRTSPNKAEVPPAGPDAPDEPGGFVGVVASAVYEAVMAAEWLTPADGAAVALASRLAADIDSCDDAQQIASLSRTLLAVLAAIGLTVAGRTSTDTPPPAQENPLDALRARAAGRLTDAKSADTATVRSIAGR